jgi:hypothetical protein
MLLKWLAALFQHGLVSVFALLIAIAAVWWVEPTTNGGIAFLLFVVFMLALAVIELGRKLMLRLKPAAPAAETAPQPSVDAPPPADATPQPDEKPAPVSRSRKRPRAKS